MGWWTRILLFACAMQLALEAPARALTAITLENGDVLTGEIVERSDENIVFDHPQLGRLNIAVRQTAAPSSPPSVTDTVAGSSMPIQTRSNEEREESEETKEEAKGGLFGTWILRGWESSLGAGLTGSEGGFEDTKLNLAFKTSIGDEKRFWDFDSAYFLNLTPERENGSEVDITKDQGFAQLRRKWFFPNSKRWSPAAGPRRELTERPLSAVARRTQPILPILPTGRTSRAPSSSTSTGDGSTVTSSPGTAT